MGGGKYETQMCVIIVEDIFGKVCRVSELFFFFGFFVWKKKIWNWFENL